MSPLNIFPQLIVHTDYSYSDCFDVLAHQFLICEIYDIIPHYGLCFSA